MLRIIQNHNLIDLVMLALIGLMLDFLVYGSYSILGKLLALIS